MIAYLKGKVHKINEKSIILVTGNVGYEIFGNTKLLSTLKEKQETEIYLYNHIREDINALYGFKTNDELEFFKILIGINGIGPKAGMEILNNKLEAVKNAIFTEDITFISKTPGIGQKTAKRMILELKGKLPDNINNRNHKKLDTTTNEDIIEALAKLGFHKNEIIKTLEKMPKNIKKEEEIIEYFLKNN